MLPKVSINVTGGITRPALNKDGVTGFICYNDNIADLTTFSVTNRIVKFTNIKSVEATGITKTAVHFKNEWYQLNEFFRLGGTEIYVGVFAIPVTKDFTELNLMKAFSLGEIKIYGVYDSANITDVAELKADLALINGIVASYDDLKKPAVAVYGVGVGTITFTLLPDLRSLAAELPYVSCIIGGDLDTTVAVNLGAVIGALSGAVVNENILNTGVYNYTDGVNMVNVGLVIKVGATVDTKVAINDIDESDLDGLNDFGYIFWRYFPNMLGTYLSNDNNCSAITNTFNSIHINRVKAKVIRELDKQLSTLVGSTLLFNANGTLRTSSASVFENKAGVALSEMLNKSEISAYDVFVDTTLNVLASKTVTVNVAIVPTESADYITLNIAFTQSI